MPSGASHHGGGHHSSHSSHHSSYHSSHSHYYGGGYSSGSSFISTKSGKATVVSIFLFIVAIFIFVTGYDLSKNKKTKKLLENDAMEYKEIIDNAKNGVEGYYTITFDGMNNRLNTTLISDIILSFSFEPYYNSKATSYSSVDNYHGFKTDNNSYMKLNFIDSYGNNVNYESYTMYNVHAFEAPFSLTLCYTLEYDKDGAWDVIPIDYSLDMNSDYKCAKHEIKINAIFFGVEFFIAFSLMFVLVIIFNPNLFKKKKKIEAKETISTFYYICKYCGANFEEESSVCPSCGAKGLIPVKKKIVDKVEEIDVTDSEEDI